MIGNHFQSARTGSAIAFVLLMTSMDTLNALQEKGDPVAIKFDKEVPKKPSDKVTEAGTLTTPKAILLRQPNAKASWVPADATKKVQTGEKLLSLPGYHSSIQMENGLELTLWGNVREFFPNPRIAESIATLHDNPQFHLEVTLERGRILIKNPTTEKRMFRVRFAGPQDGTDEVWDIVAKPNAEVGIELVSFFQTEPKESKDNPPQKFVSLYVISGDVGMQNKEEIRGKIKAGYFRLWDKSRGLGAPYLFQKLGSEHWSKKPYDANIARKLTPALESLQAKLMKKDLKTGLIEALKAKDLIERLLAIRALGALGEAGSLLDILVQTEEGNATQSPERREAISVLRHWIARGRGQKDRLYNEKTNSGILIDKKYSQADAKIILALLNPLSIEQLRQPETYQLLIRYLTDNQIIIRELAYFQLRAIVPNEKTGYTPGGTKEARQAGQKKWLKLIPPGKLPPVEKPEKKPEGETRDK